METSYGRPDMKTTERRYLRGTVIPALVLQEPHRRPGRERRAIDIPLRVNTLSPQTDTTPSGVQDGVDQADGGNALLLGEEVVDLRLSIATTAIGEIGEELLSGVASLAVALLDRLEEEVARVVRAPVAMPCIRGRLMAPTPLS